jgi:NADH dehydrogenase
VLAEGRHIPFDRLIVATGAQHAYFGHDEWATAAPGLKTIDDATCRCRALPPSPSSRANTWPRSS